MRPHTLWLAGGLLAAPFTVLPAQSASPSPVAVIVGGPREGAKAPEFKLPWANRETVGAADAPYGCGGTAGKSWSSPSTPGTSPRGAPRR